MDLPIQSTDSSVLSIQYIANSVLPPESMADEEMMDKSESNNPQTTEQLELGGKKGAKIGTKRRHHLSLTIKQVIKL